MIAAMLGLAAALSTGAASAGDGVYGLWKTPVDGGSLIRLEPCGGAVCGRVVTSPRLRAYPGQKDVRNHDPALQGRALRDLLVLKVSPTGPSR